MLETKNQIENSFIYEEFDKEFSWIEKELEEKLWELYDRAKNEKNNWIIFYFAKSFWEEKLAREKRLLNDHVSNDENNSDYDNTASYNYFRSSCEK